MNIKYIYRSIISLMLIMKLSFGIASVSYTHLTLPTKA